jgi:hypothetical protein
MPLDGFLLDDIVDQQPLGDTVMTLLDYLALGVRRAGAVLLVLCALLAAAPSFAHDPDGVDHDDDDLSVIPPGESGLLPDDATDPTLHGKIGPLLPDFETNGPL